MRIGNTSTWRSLLKSPESVYVNAVYAWNQARKAVPGWPDVVISLPDRSRRWNLHWNRFPKSLKMDADEWLDRLAGRDPFEEVPIRPLRPATLWRREYQIRQFASALVLRGRDPATLACLADLVTIDTLKEGLRFFLERSGGKPTSAIFDLATSLKAIARHHVKLGEERLDKIATLVRRLKPPCKRGLTAKNRERLRALDDRTNVRALIGLPSKLRRLAEQDQHPHRGALTMQTAVAIEILLMAPIRVGNLCALDVERHLVRPSPNGKALHVVIRPGEVKNREPLEYPLPECTVELIECYLARFRPCLAPSANSALFPGRRGTKHLGTLRKQISSVIFTHSGLRVHPHLFRHIGAKLFLDDNPGAYEVVRRVLGHRAIASTTNFYTGFETAAAVRHFDATILRLRNTGTADD
jgi:integrase